jgi:hypothetical protein
MSSTFCPHCGTPRVGFFRFCRSCGFDFDTIPATHASVPPRISQPAPTSGATPTPDRMDLAKHAARLSFKGLVNAVLVIGGVIGGALGASMLVGRNGDPLTTLALVCFVAPIAGGYLGHLLSLALLARRG